MTTLVETLAQNTTLAELSLSGRPIQLSVLEALNKSLIHNMSLTSLHIGDSSFGDEGLGALKEGLAQNKGIQVHRSRITIGLLQ